MAHLLKACDISLYASQRALTQIPTLDLNAVAQLSRVTSDTNPRSKFCGTTFQGHIEEKYPKGYQRDHIVSAYGKPHVLVLPVLMFLPERVRGKLVIHRRKVGADNLHDDTP